MKHLHRYRLGGILAVGLAVLLIGCGKTGPLYLPETPAPSETGQTIDDQETQVKKKPSAQ